jgi:hypothetical protein
MCGWKSEVFKYWKPRYTSGRKWMLLCGKVRKNKISEEVVARWLAGQQQQTSHYAGTRLTAGGRGTWGSDREMQLVLTYCV